MSTMDVAPLYMDIFSRSPQISNCWLRASSLSPEACAITVLRSYRDCDEDKIRTFVDNSILTSDNKIHSLLPNGLEIAKVVVMDVSPSGTSTILLRKGSDDKPLVEIQSNHSNMSGTHSFMIDVSGAHGNFVGDSWFGGISWSFDERYVIYVAQKKADKPLSHFDTMTASSSASSLSLEASETKQPTLFRYEESWGERYVDVSELVLVVVDLRYRVARIVPNIDSSLNTVGQPIFLPPYVQDQHEDVEDDPGIALPLSYRIAYTSWATSPRRLGMIYCYQRPCSVLTADLTEFLSKSGDEKSVHHISLTGQHLKLARSPRGCPDGRRLVVLGSTAGFDTHSGPTELFEIVIPESHSSTVSPPRIVIGVIDGSIDPADHDPDRPEGPFPGLFLDSLPRSPFVTENEIICSSLWGSRERLLRISLTSGEINCISFGVSGCQGSSKAASDRVSHTTFSETKWNSAAHSCVTLLDVRAELKKVVVSISSPCQPPRIAVISLTTSSDSQGKVVIGSYFPPVAITKKPLSSGSSLNTLFENDGNSILAPTNDHGNMSGYPVCWKILRFQESGIPFEAILMVPRYSCPCGCQSSSESQLSPRELAELLPVVVIPHGGPHACMPTLFDPSMLFLCLQLNAAILHVNYRGSTGFGARSIASLPGNIGSNDLQDIMTALSAITEGSVNAFLDTARVSVVGGSHGGFLAGHCIGQHPGAFKAAVLRNPVTNIPAMVSVSDIPDWCYVEALGCGSYDFSVYPSANPSVLTRMWEVSPVAHVSKVTAATLLVLGQKDLRVPVSQGLEYYQLLRTARAARTEGELAVDCLLFPQDVHKIDRPISEAEQWMVTADWLIKYL